MDNRMMAEKRDRLSSSCRDRESSSAEDESCVEDKKFGIRRARLPSIRRPVLAITPADMQMIHT